MWNYNNVKTAAVLMAALASCTIEEASRRSGSSNRPSAEQAVRDTRGAATLLDGSCVDSCGGKARDGNCWCDALCVEYEDCCADSVSECSGDEPVPSCAGACGGQASSGLCWCDAACEGYGDCCVDQGELCTDEGPMLCAELDESGCLGRSDCEPGYLGVCDCTCPGPTGYEGAGCDGCPASCFVFGSCIERSGAGETQCYVGGCSNELCTDSPNANSACIWQDEFACYAKPGAACEPCAANEDCVCAWSLTGEAVACMDDLDEDCPLAMCNLECEFGFAEDQNGCMVCACRENPSGQFCGGFGALTCPEDYGCFDDPDDDCDPNAGGADCGGVCHLCAMTAQLCQACPFGYQEDANGCTTCECVEQQYCSGWTGQQCPAGYTCQPNPDPTCMDCPGTCVQMNCPPVACALACEFGFKMGADGCQICECAEAPDQVCPNPNDPAVHYIGDSYENPQLCWAITFGCTDSQTLFTNDCGCGCIDQAPTTGSCVGHCGGSASDSSCYCDSQCAGLGDCCSDYEDVCGG